MATTLKSNLIIPEVIAAKIDAKLTDNMVFLPIAEIDGTLVGAPGDTLKFPSYAYIGDAADVGENGQIVPVALSETFVSATIKKSAKAVQITDEAVLSGHGDPVGEAVSQIAKAIDNHTDNDLLASLEGIGATRQYGTQDAISPDVVADTLSIFGEDEEGTKAMYIATADKATLRKNDDFIKACDIGQDMVLRGTIGELWGCQLIPANKIKSDATNLEIRRFIVKPGALKIIDKRGAMIETDREPDYARNTIYATKHYTTYLYDASKVVMLRQFTGLQTITAGVTSAAGAATNGTLIGITATAPVGYKWVYKLGTADVTNAAFGTALTSYTDWSTAEIAASTSTQAHVCLVDSTTSKPVKQINLTLVKGA